MLPRRTEVFYIFGRAMLSGYVLDVGYKDAFVRVTDHAFMK